VTDGHDSSEIVVLISLIGRASIQEQSHLHISNIPSSLDSRYLLLIAISLTRSEDYRGNSIVYRPAIGVRRKVLATLLAAWNALVQKDRSRPHDFTIGASTVRRGVKMLYHETMSRRFAMKTIGCACLLIAAIQLSAFAAKLNGTDITLTTPLRVGSVDLPPGDYRLIWEGPGADEQVTWLEHYSKVVATSRATAVEAHNEATIGRQRNPFQIELVQQGKYMVLKAIRLPKVDLVFCEVETKGR